MDQEIEGIRVVWCGPIPVAPSAARRIHFSAAAAAAAAHDDDHLRRLHYESDR